MSADVPASTKPAIRSTGKTIFALRVTKRPQRAMSVFSRASAVSSMGFVNGTLSRSILWPSSASTAISSEFAIRTVVRTPSELPIPSFVTKSSPMNASPETEIATVSPAKRTARPADEPASAAATRGGRPSWSSCLNRVTMNSE